MGEIITLHVGQAGVRIGNACWELFCHEHNLSPDGTIPLNYDQTSPDNDGINKLFAENSNGKLVPRSLFIDLEPDALDEIKKGSFRDLYNPTQLIGGKYESACTHTAGAYTRGKELSDSNENAVRKLVEACSNFQGFIITHSVSGGTGTGVTSNLVSRLSVDYGKKMKLAYTLCPSKGFSDTIVEPFNAVAGLFDVGEHCDAVVLMQSEALYNSLECLNTDLPPTYSDINRHFARHVAASTACMRFSGSVNYNLQALCTNLIPYTPIKYLVSSYGPVIPIEQKYNKQPSVETITNSAFEKDNLSVDLNLEKYKYLSCSLAYRGDIVLSDAQNAINALKTGRNAPRFIDSVETGFKVGVIDKKPGIIPDTGLADINRGVGMLTNSTAVKDMLKHMTTKSEKLFSKWSHVHWFVGEGIRSREFRYSYVEAFEYLMKDYNKLESKSEEEENDEE